VGETKGSAAKGGKLNTGKRETHLNVKSWSSNKGKERNCVNENVGLKRVERKGPSKCRKTQKLMDIGSWLRRTNSKLKGGDA